MALGDKGPGYAALLREAEQRLGIGGKAARRDDPEHRLQRDLVACVRVWSRKAAGWVPQPLAVLHPELMDLHAIPNGGKRGLLTAIKMKAEGVLAAVPDLFLPVPVGQASGGTPLHGLYLEAKTPGNYPTPEQRDMLERLARRGYAVAVFRTVEQGTELLVRYLGGRWAQTPDLLR